MLCWHSTSSKLQDGTSLNKTSISASNDLMILYIRLFFCDMSI
uniref:Uncharacterized protein n=1 Tax=Rhizophora mucronata TaxID=61149 RepID=A0A2P2PLC9_RHIMU